MAQIRLQIQPQQYPGKYDTDIIIPLSEELIRMSYQPIDIPSYNAGIDAMLCTDASTIVAVTKTRHQIAEMLRDQLLQVIIETMESHDTIMGYPQDQHNPFSIVNR